MNETVNIFFWQAFGKNIEKQIQEMTRTNEAQYFVLHGKSTRKAPKEELFSTDTPSIRNSADKLNLAEFSFTKPPVTSSQQIHSKVDLRFEFRNSQSYFVHFC